MLKRAKLEWLKRLCAVLILGLVLGGCSSSEKGNSEKVIGTSDPWYRSARVGDIAVMRGMIEGGKSINEKSAVGVTALMVAARAASPTTVKWLLENGADATLVDKDGQSALVYALVGEGKGMKLEQVVDQLVVAGSDPFRVDAIGFQPIQSMIELNMEASIRKLKLTEKKPCDRVPKVPDQASLALAARRFGHSSLAQYLEQQGCW